MYAIGSLLDRLFINLSNLLISLLDIYLSKLIIISSLLLLRIFAKIISVSSLWEIILLSFNIREPEFSKSIEYISNSNIKNIFVKSDIHIIENITIHYAKNIKLKEKNNITFFKSKDDLTNLNNLWILCYKPINGFNCSLDNLLSESWKKKDIKDYNLINLTLYEKK